MPHLVCPDHSDEAVLWDAFGWLPAQCASAYSPSQCEVCLDAILAEVFDLAQDDLAEALV